MSSRIAIRDGRDIDPLNPDPADIWLDDIAHALSHLCRFTGHTPILYTVGQHSIYCAREVFNRTNDHLMALAALMHDASEAYLADVARPIKHAFGFGELYREAEARLMEVICAKFGLPTEHLEVVTQVDNELVISERDAFGMVGGDVWPDVPAIPWVVQNLEKRVAYAPPWVYHVFLREYDPHRRAVDEQRLVA